MDFGFHRILIVNRGEAATRAIRAVRDLNAEYSAQLQAIALYTDVEPHARFVREADVAFCLGAAQQPDPETGALTSPYLSLAKLTEAIRQTGADAAWVGWGFVAERPEFAELCDKLGIIFMGPSATVMRNLGDKIAAKRLAESAGVPVTPWSNGPVDTVEQALEHADRLGYPVMLKASAGGGGRGIRRVLNRASLSHAFTSARSEAEKAFGDPTLFVETLVEGPRHVEVQILADAHGTIWPLGVRDCSVQRRSQKVVEEAPCFWLPEPIRASIAEAAVRLSGAAGYVGAGTFECLFDPTTERFFFMEMNTRIQVEHPITEATTGVDIVKQQILIAAGVPLPSAPPVTFGHAIEVRVNAENPDKGFAPAPSLLVHAEFPAGAGIRVDAGYQVGDRIPAEFDSMIGKIIAWGQTRPEALARLRRALQEARLVLAEGCTNISFLAEILNTPQIQQGGVDIGWLDRYMENRPCRDDTSAEILAACTAAIRRAIGIRKQQCDDFAVHAQRGVIRLPATSAIPVELNDATRTYEFQVTELTIGTFRIGLGSENLILRCHMSTPAVGVLETATQQIQFSLTEGVGESIVEILGQRFVFSTQRAGIVRTPSPCLVLAVHVEEGAEVKSGQPLCTVEAMKTEISITAPCAGFIRQVHVRANAQLPAQTVILDIDSSSSPHPKETATFAANLLKQASLSAPEGIAALKQTLLGFPTLLEPNLEKMELGNITTDEAWELLDVTLHLMHLTVREPLPELGWNTSGAELFNRFLRLVSMPDSAFPPMFIESLEYLLCQFGSSLSEVRAGDTRPLFLLASARHFHTRNPRYISSILQKLSPQLIRNNCVTDTIKTEKLNHFIACARSIDPGLEHMAQLLWHQILHATQVEPSQKAALSQLEHLFAGLNDSQHPNQREHHIESLLNCPYPILGFLLQQCAHIDARTACLPVLLREIYRGREFTKEFSTPDKRFIVAQMQLKTDTLSLKLGVCDENTLPQTIKELASLTGLQGETLDPSVLDLAVAGIVADANEFATRIGQLLQEIGPIPGVRRLTVLYRTLSGVPQAATFLPQLPEGGAMVRNPKCAHIHPMTAKRFDLWRFADFRLQQVASSREGISLFEASACDNQTDRRLIALADVRDLTPTRTESGAITALPHFERVFLEACASIRQALTQRAFRNHAWNQIILNVLPIVTGQEREFFTIAKRLHAVISHLALEKVVIRARILRERLGKVEEQSIEIQSQADTSISVHFTRPNAGREPPLTLLEQRILRARKIGVPHPQEILQILTSSEALPKGGFVEHDLTRKGAVEQLAPVTRSPGDNNANVVVGIISNKTTKHPEGMRRVIILGDATRDMGSLAEPECRLIIAALDMAEREHLPIEWFAVSSGAKIAMDSGTENLDWTARVLRRIIEFTQNDGVIHVVACGVNVGAQSYWNAEATMLMHCRGILIMTPRASLVLTGKRALEFSGGVSAEDNVGIGGFERIMGTNGQAHILARDITSACALLLRHHDHTYVAPGEKSPRPVASCDPNNRDISLSPHPAHLGFSTVGEIFSAEHNRERKKPFSVRAVIEALHDCDITPLERWGNQRDAETAIVFDAHIGGMPICLIGIEAHNSPRTSPPSGDGPTSWSGGTLFPQSSKKVARAINGASGNRPIVVLANLSGFDGSPESMRRLQLEYGAEIGRAVTNCESPLFVCVLSRFHGGAYVVFSQALNPRLEIIALEGAYASVIGGAPAAAVVFPNVAKRRTQEDPRITKGSDALFQEVFAQKQAELAAEFDAIHTVERAREVGSIHTILPPNRLRSYLIDRVRNTNTPN